MFHVVEVNQLEDLQLYQPAWEELERRHRARRFSLTFDWLQAYLQAVTPQPALKILIASLAGKVVGILPLVIKTRKTRLGWMRILTYPLDDWGNWYGPIGPNSAATLTAGLRYLAQSPRDWDLLDLTYVDRDRHDLGRSATAARNQGWSPLERHWQQIPAIDLSGASWSQFLERKRDTVLQEIFQAEEHLARQGSLSWRQYRSGEHTFPSEPLLEKSLNDWQTLLQQHQRFADWPLLSSITLAADQRQLLELSTLLLNQQPIAVCLGFQFSQGGEIVRSLTVPESQLADAVSREQLESVLLGRLLEAAFLRGDQLYEIVGSCELVGTAQRLWSTDLLTSYRYSCSPWSHLRSSLLLRYHAATTPRSTSKPRPISLFREQPAHPRAKTASTLPRTTSHHPAAPTETPSLRVFES